LTSVSWVFCAGGRVSPAGDRGDAGRGGRGRGGDRGRGPAGGRGGARFGTRTDSGEVAENGYDAGVFSTFLWKFSRLQPVLHCFVA
jgi:hypothetical protein